MSTTLPLFWNLSSANKKERLAASVKLISTLEKLQAGFVPKEMGSESDADDDESGEEVDDDEDDDEDGNELEDGDEKTKKTSKEDENRLNALNASDVSYSIRRLVRGLASPRESSRLGFAVALTELLSRIDTVTCAQILSLVLDASQTQGSMSGQEERDVLFARLFGITSLIRSGLLVRAHPLPSSGSASPSASSLAAYTDVLAQLLALGEAKSFLRESAWWTIGLALDALAESDVPWKDAAVRATLEVVFGELKAWSPEKLAVALKMQHLWPEREWKKLLAPTLKHGEVLHTGNLTTVSKILKDVAVDEEHEAPVKGRVWKPQVHYVWGMLLDELLPSADSKTAPKGSFQEFFRIVVDESLFASSASMERKYWGFEIFQKALPRVKAVDLPMLFTKNFMRTWINHLSHYDRYLHSFAKQIANDIQAVVQKDPTNGFPFILQLTGAHGSQQFDKLTRTKTVESILGTMDVAGIKSYIEHLLSQVNEVDSEKQDDMQVIQSRRTWIIDQFAGLVRNGAIPKDDEWIKLILDWLAVHGLFVIKKKTEKSPFVALHAAPSPPFSDDLRKQCRARLLSCLAELTTQSTVVKTSADKSEKLAGVASDGEFWIAKVLDTIDQLNKDAKHVEPLAEFDEDEKALHEKARELVSRLKKVTGDQHEAARGTELLLLSSLLQQYAQDEAEGADTESLETCIDGASRLFPESKKAKKARKSAAAEPDAEPEPEPIDVLVDTIIGFLEKATSYMRAVGNQSFSLLSGAVKESTIDLILSQLERRDPKDLAADDEDEEMEVDVDEDGSEGEKDKEEEDSDDEDESEDEEEDEDMGDEEEDPELRKKIIDALRANGIEPSTGLSDDEEEEEEMDDDQMMAIDDQLAQIFKERAKGKGKGLFTLAECLYGANGNHTDENVQREATHFKNRILDLLEIFIRRQPTNPLILRLIVPLIGLVLGSGSDETQLSTKTAGILRSRISKLKEVPTSADKEDVTQALKGLHTRARKVHSADVLATISQCSLYLAKILLHLQLEEPVLEVYRESLTDFVTRKASDLNTKFFDDFIKRYPGVAWNLRTDFLDLSEKAVNAYRQAQVFHLLETLLNQLPSSGTSPEEILSFMPTLRETLSRTISKACDETSTTPAHLKEVFKLALLGVRQTKRVASKPEDIARTWKPATWTELHTKLGANERLKSSTALVGMCKQIIQMTQIQEGKKGKKNEKSGKGEEDGEVVKMQGKRKIVDGEEAPSVKKVKRTKSKK
ncbi:hypothetical protein EVG20_g7059 [Dentipellis fragilis]|uniref:DNA polymerase V n=1 Tax=Dentipellis fragilis TaxID=205917 RepID=A0A4Y9YFV8_9AGAM|nr:hypothetical protein EVG20_g7059 [Dentipellis fragilis]